MNATLSPLHEPERTVPLQVFTPDELFFSITDGRGIIQHANAVFARLSGYPFEDLKTQPHSIVRDPAMPRGAFRLIWDELLAGRIVGSYVANSACDGSRYEVFAVFIPIQSGFLSVRMRPEPGGARDTVFAIFDRAREVEAATPGSTRDQAAAGAAYILQELSALGIPDMATSTRRILPKEVAATIEAIDELEYTAGREPLEILPGKVRMIGRLLLQPLHTLEQLDEVSGRLHESILAEQENIRRLSDLGMIVHTVTDSLVFARSEDTDSASDRLQENLEAASAKAGEVIGRAKSTSVQALEAASELRDRVEVLAQRIGVLALQNQMIGRFATELLGGATVESPGDSMRLLQQALADHFAQIVDGISAIHELAQSTPITISRAHQDVSAVASPLLRWCDAAKQLLVHRPDAASQEVVDGIAWARALAGKGFDWLDASAAISDELSKVDIKIDEMPLRATIKFLGIVTADIK